MNPQQFNPQFFSGPQNPQQQQQAASAQAQAYAQQLAYQQQQQAAQVQQQAQQYDPYQQLQQPGLSDAEMQDLTDVVKLTIASEILQTRREGLIAELNAVEEKLSKWINLQSKLAATPAQGYDQGFVAGTQPTPYQNAQVAPGQQVFPVDAYTNPALIQQTAQQVAFMSQTAQGFPPQDQFQGGWGTPQNTGYYQGQ